MTTPLPPDMPVRPGFWNVPLWGEIGVYVVGLAAVALCVWGIVRGMKHTRAGALGDPSVKSEKDPQALKRTLRAVLFADRIRETAFGNVHAALVLGFFFLFLRLAELEDLVKTVQDLIACPLIVDKATDIHILQSCMR
mgnify:CR=1 FL=1